MEEKGSVSSCTGLNERGATVRDYETSFIFWLYGKSQIFITSGGDGRFKSRGGLGWLYGKSQSFSVAGFRDWLK